MYYHFNHIVAFYMLQYELKRTNAHKLDTYIKLTFGRN